MAKRPKKKFAEVLDRVASRGVLSDAIREAVPRLAEVEDLEQTLGLTPEEWDELEYKVAQRYAELGQVLMTDLLRNKISIEFPGLCNIYLHESKVRINDREEPHKKLSILTRTAFSEDMNSAIE